MSVAVVGGFGAPPRSVRPGGLLQQRVALEPVGVAVFVDDGGQGAAVVFIAHRGSVRMHQAGQAAVGVVLEPRRESTLVGDGNGIDARGVVAPVDAVSGRIDLARQAPESVVREARDGSRRIGHGHQLPQRVVAHSRRPPRRRDDADRIAAAVVFEARHAAQRVGDVGHPVLPVVGERRACSVGTRRADEIAPTVVGPPRGVPARVDCIGRKAPVVVLMGGCLALLIAFGKQQAIGGAEPRLLPLGILEAALPVVQTAGQNHLVGPAQRIHHPAQDAAATVGIGEGPCPARRVHRDDPVFPVVDVGRHVPGQIPGLHQIARSVVAERQVASVGHADVGT